MTAEILTGPKRRRRWSADEKARIIAEAKAVGARVADVARRHRISRSLLYTWCRERAGGALTELVPVTAGPRLTRDRVTCPSEASIEIALASNVRITLRGRIATKDLRAVLAALRTP